MIAAATAFVTRHGRGLWSLAILSAVLPPVALHVAALHRGHWFPGAAAEFWQRFGAVCAHGWALVGVIGLVGWVAAVRPQAPGAGFWIRAALGARIGLLGWGVWCAAALPGFIWSARLGIPGIFEAVVPAAAIVGVAAALAGALGGWRALAGILGGVIVGPVLLWVAA